MRDFDLDVALETSGPLALVGPSGAGKSTVLRLVAGLRRPAAGRVCVGGETWFGPGVDVPAERRLVGFVFQDYALFPHMTVAGNVAFGAREPVAPVLDRLGIAHLARARPRELSGGERQRVAVARALARRPDVLLLDEPLAALDPATRTAVAAELGRVLGEARVPAVVVTHRYEEALQLAPETAVLERGRVVQVGPTAALLAAPASPFVAAFAGLNYLPGTGEGRSVRLERGPAVRVASPAAGPVAALVAPWEITLGPPPAAVDSALNHLEAEVRGVVAVGDRVRVALDGLVAEVTAESAGRLDLVPGRPVVASFKATSTRVVPR